MLLSAGEAAQQTQKRTLLPTSHPIVLQYRARDYKCRWCDTLWHGSLQSLPFTQYCSNCCAFLCHDCFETCEFQESVNCRRAFCAQCGKWMNEQKVVCENVGEQCPYRHRSRETPLGMMSQTKVIPRSERPVSASTKQGSSPSAVSTPSLSPSSTPSPPPAFDQKKKEQQSFKRKRTDDKEDLMKENFSLSASTPKPKSISSSRLQTTRPRIQEGSTSTTKVRSRVSRVLFLSKIKGCLS
jgi:hypothetical protein